MVLLLGATGLLGRNVLQVLLERGIEVRALVRSSLDVPGVDIVRGSILSKDDLIAAAAIVNALERGNGRYLLTGECLTLKEFFRIQARVGGYWQLCIVLPNWMAGILGVIGSTLRFLRIKTELYPHNVKQLLYHEWYSCARARRELGYSLTPVDDAIRDFVDWYYKKC